jgi:hypothetical protein
LNSSYISNLRGTYDLDISNTGSELTVCATADGASRVRFYFDGDLVFTDNNVPYCLENKFDKAFSDLTEYPGPHNITAIALSQQGNPLDVPLTVIVNVLPVVVARFTVYNAQTGTQLQNLTQGSSVNFTGVPSATICVTSNEAASVELYFDGALRRTDNNFPFCLGNNINVDAPYLRALGVHTVGARVLNQAGLPMGPITTVQFNVTGTFVRMRQRDMEYYESLDPFDVNNEASSAPDRKMPIYRSLSEGILQSQFYGASGFVRFEEKNTMCRDSVGHKIGLFTFKAEIGSNAMVLTSEYTSTRGWSDIPQTTPLGVDRPSWVGASVSRRFLQSNFLSRSVRIIGLSLMGTAWVLAIFFLILIARLRRDPIVRRAKPIFMEVLCFSSVMTSSTIFTLSWDEGAGWSSLPLDLSCTMAPVLFCLGNIWTFGALFMKLWRLDRVVQLRQSAKPARRALIVLVAYLTATFSLLLFQVVLDPWVWKRIVVSEIPSATYGWCTSDYPWTFLGPLALLMFVANLLMIYHAWKIQESPNDFRDRDAVMYACFVHFQAWAVGIPLLVNLGSDSADVAYFGRVVWIFVVSVSAMVIVVGPKIVLAMQERRRLPPQPENGPVPFFSDFVRPRPLHDLAASSGGVASNSNPTNAAISDASDFRFYGLPYKDFFRNAPAEPNADEERSDEGSTTHL